MDIEVGSVVYMKTDGRIQTVKSLPRGGPTDSQHLGVQPRTCKLGLKGDVARQMAVRGVFIPFGEIYLGIIHDQGNGSLVERSVGPEFLRKVLTGTIQWTKDGMLIAKHDQVPDPLRVKMEEGSCLVLVVYRLNPLDPTDNVHRPRVVRGFIQPDVGSSTECAMMLDVGVTLGRHGKEDGTSFLGHSSKTPYQGIR